MMRFNFFRSGREVPAQTRDEISAPVRSTLGDLAVYELGHEPTGSLLGNYTGPMAHEPTEPLIKKYSRRPN